MDRYGRFWVCRRTKYSSARLLSKQKKYSFPDDFAPSSGWQGCWQAGTDARTQAYLVGSISPEDVPTSPSWTDSAQLAAGLELRWAKGEIPRLETLGYK